MSNSDLTIHASVKITLNEKILQAIEKALKPESENPSSERSKTSVTTYKNELIIETWASDTTALRASLNSYLRWVEGIQNIVENIEQGPKP
jgi:tRNA threonylcarbamoyladenosine modification (KEOPS) complex  Pcc1 subunit